MTALDAVLKSLKVTVETIQEEHLNDRITTEVAKTQATKAIEEAFTNINQENACATLKTRFISTVAQANGLDILEDLNKLIFDERTQLSRDETNTLITTSDALLADLENSRKEVLRASEQSLAHTKKVKIQAENNLHLAQDVQEKITKLEQTFKEYQNELTTDDSGLLSVLSNCLEAVKKRLLTQDAPKGSKKWNELLDILFWDDILFMGAYKRYALEDFKESVKQSKSDVATRLAYYKEMLEHLIEATTRRKIVLKSENSDKEKLEAELVIINQAFFHYYQKYRASYSATYFFLPQPCQILINKSYANLGYSKWNQLKELFKIENVPTWKLPYIIIQIIKNNSVDFVNWVETHPHSVSILASDISLVKSILNDENDIKKLQKSLQAHTFTLACVDALGFCLPEPPAGEKDLKFKALVDCMANLPLVVTVILRLTDGISLKNVLLLAKDALITDVIQKINHQVDPHMLKQAETALSILNGQSWQEILVKERNYMFLKAAGSIKQAIQHPAEAFDYLKKFWWLWQTTLSQATGREKLTRIVFQVIIPLVGILPATAYLVSAIAGAYFSLWTCLTLLVGASSVSCGASTLLYRFTNIIYQQTAISAERMVQQRLYLKHPEEVRQKDEKIVTQILEDHVNDEIAFLQNYLHLPKIPKAFQKQTIYTKCPELIEKMTQHLTEQLEKHAINEGDEKMADTYVKVFNQVFVMKDIRLLLEDMIESELISKTKASPEPLEQLIRNEILSLIASEKEQALSEIDAIVFTITQNLINKWLKGKLMLFWKNQLNEPQDLNVNTSLDHDSKAMFKKNKLQKQYKYLKKHDFL